MANPGNRERILALVQGFAAHARALLDPQTNEAVVRQEYIDPFWDALGWDMANAARRGHAEKDVVIEARVGTIEALRQRTRRPDYLFRIDGVQQIIAAKKKLQAPALGQHERDRLERQVESTENQIDERVCRLYGVSQPPAEPDSLASRTRQARLFGPRT